MEQPILNTDRLILEPFQSSDIQDIFKYASNPEVAKFTLWEAHKSLDDSKSYLEWINSNTKSLEGQLFFVWAIREKALGQVIGSIDFKNIYPHSGQFDYALSREYWNKGLMTEAAKEVMRWAFESSPKLMRLQAYCFSENTGSRRIMEKCGMKFEGERQKNILFKGSLANTVHYAYVR